MYQALLEPLKIFCFSADNRVHKVQMDGTWWLTALQFIILKLLSTGSSVVAFVFQKCSFGLKYLLTEQGPQKPLV